MIYYIYPEGSKSHRAKTSKRWKAFWYGQQLRLRELYRWVRYGVSPRRICTETHLHDDMYGYGAHK